MIFFLSIFTFKSDHVRIELYLCLNQNAHKFFNISYKSNKHSNNNIKQNQIVHLA